MSSWEERMARTAAARATVAEAEQIARCGAENPHRGHHQHLRGTMVSCSCGEDFGVTCVVIDFDFDPETLICRECGARGVVLLG
jgi:ribosomal protein L40E